MGSGASSKTFGPKTDFLVPPAEKVHHNDHQDNDGAKSLFSDTPTPRVPGALDMATAMRLKRVQRGKPRNERVQLDVVGTDDDFAAVRSTLQTVRAHVWSKSTHTGQVVCVQFTISPVTGFVASATKVSRSVHLAKIETKVSMHRLRVAAVYKNRKGEFGLCLKHHGISKKCSRCSQTRDQHRVEQWTPVTTEDARNLCTTGAIVGVVRENERDTRVLRATIINAHSATSFDVEYQGNLRASHVDFGLGHVDDGTVSGKCSPDGTFSIWPDHLCLQTFTNISSDHVSYSYVCGKGARVAVLPTDEASSLSCGTVVDLRQADGLYTVRLDNSDDTVRVDLRADNALPEARPQYDAGQRLMLLPPDQSSKSGLTAGDLWVDAEVLLYMGQEHGSRHRLRLLATGSEVEMDLNRFNHAPQLLGSVQNFLRVREEYRQHLLDTRYKVQDAMTGRWLNVEDQTVNIGTTSINAVAPSKAGSEGENGSMELVDTEDFGSQTDAGTENDIQNKKPPPTMQSLVAPLATRRFADRSHGTCRVKSTVIRADAGTGKTWGMQQLEFSLAQQASSFEALPLILHGQELSNMARKTDFGAAPGADGASLLRAYVEYRFSGERRTMLLQSLRLHALVVLFDGVDEVLELREQLHGLFADELLAKRHPFVVTSRPTGIENIDRFGGDCRGWDLRPLTDEQIMYAMTQQLHEDEFFAHLFAFKKLRAAQDKLYYEVLASKSVARKEVEALGAGIDRFRLADGRRFDPEMRQKTLDGKFLRAVTDGTFASRSVRAAHAKLAPLCSDLDSLVRNVSILDGLELDKAVRELDPASFGSGDPEDDDTFTKDQKTIFRVAKRLAKYTRRLRVEAKAATNDTPPSNVAGATSNTDVSAVWSHIACNTDQLMEVAEHFQAAFKAAIHETVGDDIEVHFAPLKDPVRALEKAFDDYADRFDDGVSPLTCIIDVLRCAVCVTRIAEIIDVMRDLRAGVEFEYEGHRYRLELVRAKNKFAPHMLTPSHYRNILLNVRLVRLDNAPSASGPCVFGEVQIKVDSIVELLEVHHSHAHYEYFRSLLEGQVELVDPMLNRLFEFTEEVCRVPVLMSLLIVVMDKHSADASDSGDGDGVGHGDSGPAKKVPLDRNELYKIAIEKVLHRWDAERAAAALRVLTRIAQRNVLKRKNQRIFEEKRDVAPALRFCSGDERDCWRALRETAPSNMPLIKASVESATAGIYQFKHLSLQENLAGAAVAAGGDWEEGYKCIRGVTSQPLCDAVVLSCLQAGSLEIRADDLLNSCKQAGVSLKEKEILQALTTQCDFPASGVLNLKDCEWVTDDTVLAWARPGSQVHCIDAAGCTQLGARGVTRLLECCREITQLAVPMSLMEDFCWEVFAALCDAAHVTFASRFISGDPKRIKTHSDGYEEILALGPAFNAWESLGQPLPSARWTVASNSCEGPGVYQPITALDMSSNPSARYEGVNAKAIKALAPAFQAMTGLESLKLSFNKLGLEGAKALTQWLYRMKGLKFLKLYSNELKAEGAKALVPALQTLTGLESLSLSANDLRAEGAKALVPALHALTGLRSLNLSANKLGLVGAKALVPALRAMTGLKFLYLGKNNLKAVGAKALVPALRAMTGLKSLNLSDNELKAEGAKALLPVLRVLKGLESLNLSHNWLGTDFTSKLRVKLIYRMKLNLTEKSLKL